VFSERFLSQMNNLQVKLQYLLKEKNLSPAELERKAGLKMSAVRNILTGQSKKPSGETLYFISRVLGVSVDELLDIESIERAQNMPLPEIERNSPAVTDLDFYQLANERTIGLIKKNYPDKTFTSTELAHFTKEIHGYSLKNTYPEIDEKFADWIISQRLADR
jgi:transcriptional regulator with XRE-family HTH domain